MFKSGNHQPGVIVKRENGQRRLVATQPFAPDADRLILHEAPVISAPEPYAPSYRAWLMVCQILVEPVKLRWFTGKHFAVTRQPWDAEDQSFAKQIQAACGSDPPATQALYFSVVTNHLAFWDASGAKVGSGLFETLCFTNHSCAPNSMTAPLIGHLGTALFAIKPIAPGEEITWNYLSSIDISRLPFFDRQKWIQEEFQFQCQCIRCR